MMYYEHDFTTLRLNMKYRSNLSEIKLGAVSYANYYRITTVL